MARDRQFKKIANINVTIAMVLFMFFERKDWEDGALPSMSTCQRSSLTKAQLGGANKAVLEEKKSSEKAKRGKYNCYTPEQRARIGK